MLPSTVHVFLYDETRLVGEGEETYQLAAAVTLTDQELEEVRGDLRAVVETNGDLGARLLAITPQILSGRWRVHSGWFHGVRDSAAQTLSTAGEPLTSILDEVNRELEHDQRLGIVCSKNPVLCHAGVWKALKFAEPGQCSGDGFLLAELAALAQERRDHLKFLYKRFRADLLDFQEWIERFPSLGAQHPVGKRLLEAIEAAATCEIRSESWFRAREAESGKVFSSLDMGAPPAHLVRAEGRYNHVGKPVLYLSSDARTCASEIIEPGNQRLLWLQEFKVHKKTVLDLTHPLTPHPKNWAPWNLDLSVEPSGLLVSALIHEGTVQHAGAKDGNPFRPEYYIPRFVADAARASSRHFDGIRYRSTRGEGHNLALFDWDEGVIPVGSPSVGIYNGPNTNGG